MQYYDSATLPSEWRILKFKDFLKRVRRKFFLEDQVEYEICGVRWYGNGVFLREVKYGREIKRKDKYTLRASDIVYNKLFAWRGSFAIVDTELDGACVSDKFPTYRVDEDKVILDYLRYYFRTEKIRKNAAIFSKGVASTSKFTLNPSDFPKLELPAPPVQQQRQIVAILDIVFSRANELKSLVEQLQAEIDAIVPSISNDIFNGLYSRTQKFYSIEEISDIGVPKGWRPEPVDNQVPFIPMVMVDQETGLRSKFEMRPLEKVRSGKVRFRTPVILLAKITPSTENNKTSLIIDLPTNGGYATTEVFAIHPKTMVEPKYLLYHLRTERIRRELIEQMTGTSGRQRVPTEALKNLRLVLPPRNEQLNIIERIEFAQSRAFVLRENMSEYLERVEALFPTILERVFTGEFQPNIPEEVVEKMKVFKAEKRKQEEDLLAGRRAIETSKQEQTSMKEIEINTSADLTRLLVELIDSGTTRVSAKELWQLSGLTDIDTFHTYLKDEYKAGRITEQREEREIYLEPNRETENLVD